jgi:hypothetical protein
MFRADCGQKKFIEKERTPIIVFSEAGIAIYK